MLTVLAPDWMIVDAVRYAIGRRTYQVSVTCEWLRENWKHLDGDVQGCISRDVDEAFLYAHRLGDPCDRDEWVRVRALWQPATGSAGRT